MRLFWRSHNVSEERRESEDYPMLGDLIGAYFNQDWNIIFKTEDPDEVIAILKQENSSETIQSLIRNIERFLAKYGHSDAELNDALERVFQPDDRFYNSKGRATREGLEKVIEILTNPPKTSSPTGSNSPT